MKRIVSILAAALTLLVSCSKEMREEQGPSPTPESGQGKTVLTVTSAFTKTTLGDLVDGSRQIYWANGDCINVNGNTSEALSGVAANTDKTASFVFDTEDITAPYNTVYPASIYTSESTVTLPAEAADGIVPLAGTGSESPISLGALTSMLKVSVTNPESSAKTITQIKVSSDGTRLSGAFVINYGSCTLTPAPNPEGADTTVYIAGPWALAKDATRDFFIPLPAGTYGITVEISYSDGKTVTLGPTPEVEFTKGQIIASPGISYVLIGSAEELVAFATAYNSGDYASYGSNLKVTVTQNLVFDSTTSSAFNATGGIGTSGDTNRFDGLFNGNNKTISGLESTVPLFNGTASSAIIKDMNLDNSCSFTFTNPGSGNFEKGAIVGYHRGTLDNVSVAADVSLAAATTTGVTALGGLVGRIVVGSIENGCEYSGLISTPADFSSSNKIMIGGLAGEITNASGSVSNSNFKGAISNEAQETEGSDQNNPYLIIGGIVGQLSAGEVTACNTTSDHATVAGAYDGSEGIIVNKTILAYCSAAGGIVGENVAGTVSGCENGASVFITLFKKDNNNANGRRTSTGGIVGINQSKGTVTGCTNHAALSHRTNTYFQYLGGAVGRNFGTVTSCTNDGGALGMMTSGVGSFSARYPHIGGVIAENGSASTVSDLHNRGNITLSRLENTSNVYSYIGGVIGLNAKAIDGGATKNITNSGTILQNYTPGSFSADGFNLGGIVGKTTAAVSNVSNSGTVQFDKTTSGGDATANSGSFNIGGVAGWSSAAISGAENTGEVYFLNTLTTAASTGGYNIGGIAGYTTASVTGCTNSTGDIHYRQQTNGCILNNVRLGGVAGYVNAEEAATVQNNTNSSEIYFQADIKGVANSVEYHYIYFGGIIGYGKNLSIDNCHNTGYVHGGQGTANLNQENTVIAGGVIGYLNGASSITGCSHKDAELYNDHWANRDSNAYDGPLTGGIAGITYGTAESRISVEECTVSGDATIVHSRRGSVGGILGSGIYSDISDCTVSIEMDGTVSGRAQSGYNYGGIAGIITNSTVSGCTFSGTTINSSQVKTGGGIVGKIITGTSVIDGCSSYATSITKSGGATTAGSIVGTSVTGTTIQNCHYKTTYAIAGTGDFTDGGGNAADL